MKDIIYTFKLIFSFWFLFEWLLDVGAYRNTLVWVAFGGWVILTIANRIINKFAITK